MWSGEKSEACGIDIKLRTDFRLFAAKFQYGDSLNLRNREHSWEFSTKPSTCWAIISKTQHPQDQEANCCRQHCPCWSTMVRPAACKGWSTASRKPAWATPSVPGSAQE